MDHAPPHLLRIPAVVLPLGFALFASGGCADAAAARRVAPQERVAQAPDTATSHARAAAGMPQPPDRGAPREASPARSAGDPPGAAHAPPDDDRSPPDERTDDAPPTRDPPPDDPVPAAGAPAATEPLPREERTQFVLYSIDNTPAPGRTLDRDPYAAIFRGINARRPEGAPPNSFTLFVGAVGLQLDPDTAARLPEDARPYVGLPPRPSPTYEYADDAAEVIGRAERLAELHALGVEIAAHGVRHAHGREWSAEQWRSELDDFVRVMDLFGLPHPVGFRAPFLERNDAMYETLAASGFAYDASAPGGDCWPTRRPGTNLWVFGIPTVQLPGGETGLFFDLNMETLLRRAAAAAEIAGEPATTDWVDEQYEAIGYREFVARYRGRRVPFLVSGHGGFRLPTMRLLRRVCELPMVRCAAFREAAAYLQEHPEMEGVCR